MTRIVIQVILKLNALRPLFQFKIPLKANAAAKGAVIAEEIPAANSPIAINILAQSPNNGCKDGAKSAALCSCSC